MIEVKDVNGATQSIPTTGKVNAALTTGIIGTTLGALGGLGALTGINNGNGGGILNSNGNGCKVSQEKYYEDRIADIRANNAQAMAFQLQLCDLSARVASNEVANSYQNRLVETGFNAVDTRFVTENIINEKNLALALCKVPQGDVYLSPTKLADNYIAPSRILDSYIPREYAPARGFYGGQCGAAYGGHDGHCGPCGF